MRRSPLVLRSVPAEQGAAPDCQKPTLLRRYGFRQQVSLGVRPMESQLRGGGAL